MNDQRKVLALSRMLRYIVPSQAEIEFLASIPGADRQLKANERILDPGKINDVSLLLDGWAANASVTADGDVRINTINLPGDMLGMASLVMPNPFDHVYALTPVTLRQISADSLRTIFEELPRLAAVIMLIAQEERAAKNEWVLLHAASAEKRFAGFLYRTSERLEHLSQIGGFDRNVPLTQRQLAEIVGVTPAYIHQLDHQFQADGLITFRRGHLSLLEPERLRELAGLSKWEVAAPLWLPGSRELAEQD